MAQYLSANDMERIEQFARTPMHQRTPEMLLPEETQSTE
jgi:hypothetical protein